MTQVNGELCDDTAPPLKDEAPKTEVSRYPAGFEADGAVCILAEDVLKNSCTTGIDHATRMYPGCMAPGFFVPFVEVMSKQDQYANYVAADVYKRHPDRCVEFLGELGEVLHDSVISVAKKMVTVLEHDLNRPGAVQPTKKKELEIKRAKLLNLVEVLDEEVSELGVYGLSEHELDLTEEGLIVNIGELLDGYDTLTDVISAYDPWLPCGEAVAAHLSWFLLSVAWNHAVVVATKATVGAESQFSNLMYKIATLDYTLLDEVRTDKNVQVVNDYYKQAIMPVITQVFGASNG